MLILEVRGGNRKPILIPLSRLRERAGEREKYRSRFASARLYGTHVPLAILVPYRGEAYRCKPLTSRRP